MDDGFTALMCAALGGHEAMAQLLLQHGADVAAAMNNGSDVCTALMLLLLKVAMRPWPSCCYSTVPMWRQQCNDGFTALMLAAQGGHEAVAQLLLQHGADVAAAFNDGSTALMLAAQGGHEAVAQLLLQHGADVAAARQPWCHSIDVGC